MKHALEIWRDEYRETCVLEGRREGELKGRREEALKIAAKLRAKGTSVEDTAEATGLTIDEILRL